MQRSLRSMAWLALLLTACPDGKADSDSDATSEVVTSILPPTTADDSTSTGEPGTTVEPDPTGTGSSTTTDDGPISCDDFTPAKLEPVVPRIVLVLDKSGSMLLEWDHDGDPATEAVSRWSSLRAVVESMVGGLDSVVQFGAVLFPSLEATSKPTIAACVVDAGPLVPVGPQSGAAILAAIPPGDTTTIAGGTPSTQGILAAVSELDGLEGDDEPKFIIFITDGAANCDPDNEELFDDYDDRLAQTVADARTAGYQTHVVGIDISNALTPVLQDGNPDGINPWEKLNELAEIAGTARDGDEKFYNATNEQELQAALMAITGDVVSCEINLGKPVPDSFYIQLVEIGEESDEQEYPGMDTQVGDCDSESGWQYTSPARDAIRLCGAACEHYKATGLIEIEYGCFIP
ncbi:vWA domain-containing protein [Nannocystis punicea]|uniref:VWA domain-containing protein n=1 Tax=Nannocystis punicea TaxID=2995304 RepID=A0ABY7GRM6_9BACT|nr:vWA domain-containing protein [Nannocystis poenicansa]WAS89566.1 VWA domain-containing protein [Nannocystis poenicansa]